MRRPSRCTTSTPLCLPATYAPLNISNLSTYLHIKGYNINGERLFFLHSATPLEPPPLPMLWYIYIPSLPTLACRILLYATSLIIRSLARFGIYLITPLSYLLQETKTDQAAVHYSLFVYTLSLP